MKKSFIACTVFIAVCLAAQELRVDFDSENSWKAVENAGNRLKIENREFASRKATVVTLSENAAKNDTAFLLIAPDYALTGRKSLRIRFRAWAPRALKNYDGKVYFSAIRWYDVNRKEIAPASRIWIPNGVNKYRVYDEKLTVPANAVTAKVQIGFDNPDIKSGQFFAISDVIIGE